MHIARRLALLVVVLLQPAQAAERAWPELALAPPPSRPAAPEARVRCTADGAHCIRSESYLRDVCRVIAAAAVAHGLDTGFFARLLWRESLFDPSAVSPAGAEGIAQFMPGTARLRGLADPYNPAAATFASAAYLADLVAEFGNLGLAAAAYNAGENRVRDYRAGERGLPAETRSYVLAITGHSGKAWRDAPPDRVNLALSEGDSFPQACEAKAGTRTIAAFRAPTSRPPRGVVVAAARQRTAAETYAERVQRRHAALLGEQDIAFVSGNISGVPAARVTAQVPFADRNSALAFCRRMRADGGFCRVQRN
ncbi:lytic transglycosylase domain-containing protein [Tranquillimonas alkanivorans]|uniref:Transglycosylase SLT domain-containing protein n=1 Tax=Tranquillimonas alkanivorans TaxID=441119 RepID=A0A1I5NNW8_9RHOB|nr:lytic transglycosylase domain-containing protein [Tranquillimonas alkanivorans]SFP23528.1 Transglycosylase SLT domain-containing protein [Tranquillimonas alkanivorans]